MYRDNLKPLFAKYGVSNTQIAEVCKVSNNTVTNWIKGKTKLSLDNAIDICDYLEISLDELAGREAETDKDLSYIERSYNSMNQEGKDRLLEQAAMLSHAPRFQREGHIAKEA